MATRFWPNRDPLGARLTCVFLPGQTLEVVGVVKDAKIDALDATSPADAMYLSFRQLPNGFMQLILRTASSPLALVGAVTHAVHEIDPEQPVTNVRTMDEITAGSISRRRFTMLLLAAFAGMALVLAAVGIYSVLSYAVRQRVREIGIRLALGARPSDVLRMTVRDGMRPTLVGVVIGVIGAAAISRLLSSFFFGISGTDPATFSGVAALVLVVGLSASLLPAYRATHGRSDQDASRRVGIPTYVGPSFSSGGQFSKGCSVRQKVVASGFSRTSEVRLKADTTSL